MKTPTQSRDEFVFNLNNLLKDIKERAERQYEYNINKNIPAKILSLDESAQHAIDHGLVSAISKMNEWDVDSSVRFAFAILEDVNAHSEAKELVKFIPEYQ